MSGGGGGGGMRVGREGEGTSRERRRVQEGIKWSQERGITGVAIRGHPTRCHGVCRLQIQAGAAGRPMPVASIGSTAAAPGHAAYWHAHWCCACNTPFAYVGSGRGRVGIRASAGADTGKLTWQTSEKIAAGPQPNSSSAKAGQRIIPLRSLQPSLYMHICTCTPTAGGGSEVFFNALMLE